MLETDDLIELEIQVRDLLSQLEAEEANGGPDSSDASMAGGTIGRLARQDALQQHELAKEAQRRRHLRIRELKAALQRMDNGTYGRCLNCHQFIALPRLQMAPESSVCGQCAAQ